MTTTVSTRATKAQVQALEQQNELMQAALEAALERVASLETSLAEAETAPATPTTSGTEVLSFRPFFGEASTNPETGAVTECLGFAEVKYHGLRLHGIKLMSTTRADGTTSKWLSWPKQAGKTAGAFFSIYEFRVGESDDQYREVLNAIRSFAKAQVEAQA